MPSEFLIQEFLLQGDGFCNVWSERSFCGTALWQWCRAICLHAHAPACMSIRSPCLNSLGESCGGRHEQKVLWLRIFRSKNILIKEVFLWLKVHIVWLLLMHMRLQPPLSIYLARWWSAPTCTVCGEGVSALQNMGLDLQVQVTLARLLKKKTANIF